ncbi:L-asparaginase [Constrictibacter sp. MBR-5]|jgi:L-asparaginase|uniref:asparaginase n=1 Tax=Constrictibacter sp. MBR-5 TaxID=3156467 RepID=UPI0033940564
MTTQRPRVAVIGTGGTMSSVGRHPLDLIEYPDTGIKLQVDELIERFPIVHEVADVVPIRFQAVGSTQIGPKDWLDLLKIIHDAAAQDPAIDGFVVTHGTATTEETAWFLGLAAKVEQPIVVVGAQRPSSGLGTDAGINLVNAIRTAGSPAARGMGALVVLNDEIQSAREVTKTSTLRQQTFRSPDFGILGHADADAVAFYRKPLRRHMPDTEFDVAGLDALPRVDIAYAYAGVDGVAVDAYVAAGAKGIVTAGFAPGSTSPAETDALDRAVAAGVVVVQSTRAGSGRVTQRANLSSHGFVAADNLNPQKARILLMLALTVTQDRKEIERIFATY